MDWTNWTKSKIDDKISGTPGVGHIVALLRFMAGDPDGGKRSLKMAMRGTACKGTFMHLLLQHWSDVALW